MKKNSIIKAITITFLVYAVLSWIIPGGTFQEATFTKASETTPIGLSDIFIYGISTATTSIFVLIAVVLLLIGGLYGVINKTGVYQKVVEGTVKKFSGKEKVFLIISILIFAILASLTTLTLPLFVMVPFFVAVILLLGYDKMTAMLSTVGAILVGNMGSIFGYNNGGYNYVNYFFKLKMTDNIVFKVVLFVLLTAVLIFFTLRTSKLEKKEVKKAKKSIKKEEKAENKEEVIVPLYKKVETSKKSAMPLVIVVILSLIIALVAMYNWAGALNVEKTIFTTWHENITNVKLNGYPLFANLLGSVNPMGAWSNYEFAMLLVITILVIGFVYNLKIKETYEAAVEGMKEILPVAVVAALANILLLVVNSVGSTYFATIYNFFFKLNKGFNFITMSVVSFIGSIGYSDFPYLLNSVYAPVSAKYAKHIKEVVFILQAMYGYAMLLVPTSVGLVAGLQYLNISFKEWFKENWRLLVSLLLVTLIMIIIMVLI